MNDNTLIIFDRRYFELMKLWGYSPKEMAILEDQMLAMEVKEIIAGAEAGKNTNLAYAAHGSAKLHLFYEGVTTPEQRSAMVNKQLLHMIGECREFYVSLDDSEANEELADIVILCLDLLGFMNMAATRVDLEMIATPFERGTMLTVDSNKEQYSATIYDAIAWVGTKFRKEGGIDYEDLGDIIYVAIRAMTGTDRIKVILDKMRVNFNRPPKHGVAINVRI